MPQTYGQLIRISHYIFPITAILHSTSRMSTLVNPTYPHDMYLLLPLITLFQPYLESFSHEWVLQLVKITNIVMNI